MEPHNPNDSSTSVTPRTLSQLETGLPFIRDSPKDNGVLEMIVARPGIELREVLHIGS
jgi:hypothetical protein